MTSALNDDETRKIKDLKKGIEDRKRRLTQALKGHDNECKWKYPEDAMEIIKEAQAAAKVHSGLVNTKLTELLEWPSKEKAREDFFYEATGPNSMFNRNQKWFDTQGFEKFNTQYSFSDRWDKQPLNVTIYVPKSREPKHKSPVMWFFHGGGFCTGASDFIPWYSQTSVRRALAKDAIIIAPDYPLGPEGNYIDIYDAIYDFLWWYKEDGCFEDEVKGKRFKSWQDWLRYKLRDKTFTVDKNRVYIEGESAGAHAAVTAMWLNAARGEDFGINIKAALLRYPMIAHYKRELPGEGGKVGYMDEQFGRDDIQSQAKKVEEEILRLEKLGIVPTCTGRAPARGMAFAFLLSMSQIWQLLFQRDHHDPHLRTEPDPKDEKKMDGIERAWRCAESIHARLLPPIYIYHGKDDTNCPVEDTQEFVDILKNPDIYGEHFKNDDRLCLDVIKRLEKAPVWHVKENELRHEVKTEVTHGFDYWLDEENEPFLKKAYDWVGKHWGK